MTSITIKDTFSDATAIHSNGMIIDRSTIETHLAAGDQYADAAALLAAYNDAPTAHPKYLLDQNGYAWELQSLEETSEADTLVYHSLCSTHQWWYDGTDGTRGLDDGEGSALASRPNASPGFAHTFPLRGESDEAEVTGYEIYPEGADPADYPNGDPDAARVYDAGKHKVFDEDGMIIDLALEGG